MAEPVSDERLRELVAWFRRGDSRRPRRADRAAREGERRAR